MAHNQMVDHFRTRKQTSDLDGIDVPEDAEAETIVLAAEMSAALEQALGRLSEDHRQVLTLRFLMEKSAREIGEIMGRKEVTVRGLQMRALQALRRLVAEELLPAAPAEGGLASRPGGPEVYRLLVREQTTTPLEPQAVHAIGLREVARLRTEMDALRAPAGFEGDLDAFMQWLHTDPRFFHRSADRSEEHTFELQSH